MLWLVNIQYHAKPSIRTIVTFAAIICSESHGSQRRRCFTMPCARRRWPA